MKFSHKKKFILVYTFVFLLLFLAFYFDNQIVILVSHIRNSLLNSFFVLISSDILIFIAFLSLTILFIKENKRKWILPMWLTLALSELIGFLLKITAQRQRPFQLGLVSIIGAMENGFSFPSLHAMLVFSVIPFLSKENKKFRYVWIVFACLVVFSRIYLGVHFLSDVIAGALIGYTLGYFIVRSVEKR